MGQPGRPRAAPAIRGAATGSADLPLHGGHVPSWLFHRMARLGRVIAEAIVHEYGRAELLRRLSHPFWFQAFGALMGMDWHSSGITTSVVGALQRGLSPLERELGLRVCGGRGRHSRRTPEELGAFGARTGLDGDALARTSRLVAKVDGAAVQDGYELYLHAFVVADDGAWVVVQQGMDAVRRRCPPLPLALRGPALLRGGAARRDRGPPGRRDREPHRPPGGGLTGGAARARRRGPGPRGRGAAADRRGAAPPGAAGAPRRPAG
jgi:hypothetical protein